MVKVGTKFYWNNSYKVTKNICTIIEINGSYYRVKFSKPISGQDTYLIYKDDIYQKINQYGKVNSWTISYSKEK